VTLGEMERSSKLLDGVVTGIPKRSHKPVVDGIITGVPRPAHLALKPELHKVVPSATQNSVGTFGAGRTPQGQGDGKGGMKSAHSALPKRKAKAEALEKHIAEHNM